MNRHLVHLFLPLVLAAGLAARAAAEPHLPHRQDRHRRPAVSHRGGHGDPRRAHRRRGHATPTSETGRLRHAARRSGRQDGAAGADRLPRPRAERVDVRVRAAGAGHGERRGRARVHPGAGRGDRAGAMDHAVAGFHHAPARAALSDARRARRGGAEASGRLPHRSRRVAELAGAEAERHRRGLQSARRRAVPRRARPERAADRHPAQLRALHQDRVGRTATDRRRSPGRGSSNCSTDYNSVGITSIVDANADEGGLELYRTLLRAGRADRAGRSWRYGVDAQAPLEAIEEAIRDGGREPAAQVQRRCSGCAASRRSWTAAC